MPKLYDVLAVTGEYMDQQTGQKRPRFENVGAITQNQEGKMTLLLKKTFNPAGLAEPNRESIALLIREPQQRAQQAMQQPAAMQQRAPAQAHQQAAPVQNQPQEDFDDDIPF